MSSLLVIHSNQVKEIRLALETRGYYDNSRRITKQPQNECSDLMRFALPINDLCVKEFSVLLESGHSFPIPFEGCELSDAKLPLSKRELAKQKTDYKMLQQSIENLLTAPTRDVCVLSDEEKEEMLSEVPKSWERHGDLIVLPTNSFSGSKWDRFITVARDTVSTLTEGSASTSSQPTFWEIVALSLRCKRLARDRHISNDGFRSSGAELILGADPLVDHIDNGIHYVFDVTKCMFSSGNITEKLRVGSFDCSEEIVLDLYAGIGYFVLPYLVHAQARLVHACEWNPHAVESLRKGLVANGVEERCVIHCGDNKKFSLRGIVHRVNLGLIPSSEEGWPIACAALNSSTGGWLHIHGNVSTKQNSKKQHRPLMNIKDHGCKQPSDAGELAPNASAAIELSSSSHKHRGVYYNTGTELNQWEKCDSSYEKDDEEQSESHNMNDRVSQCLPSSIRDQVVPLSKKQVWKEWSCYVAGRILTLLERENPLTAMSSMTSDSSNDTYMYKNDSTHLTSDDLHIPNKKWKVAVRHVEHVKSYAPNIDHLVADVECRIVDQ